MPISIRELLNGLVRAELLKSWRQIDLEHDKEFVIEFH